jgi:hypothetical protein
VLKLSQTIADQDETVVISQIYWEEMQQYRPKMALMAFWSRPFD